MFDTQFDAPPPAPEPEVVAEVIPEEPPAPPVPTFSEAELEDAKRHAWDDAMAEGIRQGKTEAMGAQGEVQNKLLDVISTRLADMLAEQTVRYNESRDLSLQIALTITRKLLPTYAQRNGLGEIEAMITNVLSEITTEPRLVVHVADSQLDTVTIKVQREVDRRGFNGKVIYMGEPNMGPADCRIEWADGGAERDMARLWSEIDRVAAQVLQASPTPTARPATSHQPDSSTNIDS